MLPYVWLSLAMVWLWLPPQRSARPSPLRLSVSAAWLALAAGHGYATGVVTPLGVLVILAFGLLCYRHSQEPQAVTTIAVILFSLGLMAHVIPGFSNLLVTRDSVRADRPLPAGVRATAAFVAGRLGDNAENCPYPACSC